MKMTGISIGKIMSFALAMAMTVGATFTSVQAAPVVQNPGFETDTATIPFPGYTTAITNWTTNRDPGATGGNTGNSGLNTATGPFHSGAIPEGVQVLFLQNNATVTQSVAGFEAGKTYQISYYENARGGNLPKTRVLLNGVVIVPEHDVTPSTTGYYLRSATFTSPGAGAFDLVIHNNSSPTGDNTALFDGISIVEVGGPPSIAVNFTAHNFGPVSLGDSTTHGLTISNSGGSALNVTSLALSGAAASSYAVVSPTGAFTVGAGSASNVVIRFTPAAAGDLLATLTINSNAPGQTALPIALSGRGASGIEIVNPSFEVDPNPPSPGYSSQITGWTTTGGGVGFMNSTAYPTFYDNGLPPNGTQVAFIQNGGSMAQSIPGFKAGKNYQLSIWVNTRTNDPVRQAALRVTIGGADLIGSASAPVLVSPSQANGEFTVPFTHLTQNFTAPTAGNLTLTVIHVTPAADTTLLFDHIEITEAVNDAQGWLIYQ